MAGRPRVFDEEKVIEKALNLFWSNGYEGTSTEDLILKMGINKGSLYHAYGSKRALFIRVLDDFSKKFKKNIGDKIKNAKDPVEGIRQFFMELAIENKGDHLKGCFVGNSLAELTNIDRELTDITTGYLKGLENVFYECIEDAKKLGILKNKEDSHVLARYLLTLWNGINITRRMYPNREILQPLIKMQLSVLH